MGIRIIPLEPDDWPSILFIYEEGIASGRATFETEAPSWESWNDAHFAAPRLKAVEDSRIVGWAALGPAFRRAVYRGVAEVSVYVAEASRGRGIGTALLARLVSSSEDHGLWTLQAGIFSSNRASIALHTACGFRVVGVRERLGQLKGVWHDVVLMERRSSRVG
jgi:phosphinothricin acetyltransferase